MWWWTQLHEAKTWANGELADTRHQANGGRQAPPVSNSSKCGNPFSCTHTQLLNWGHQGLVRIAQVAVRNILTRHRPSDWVACIIHCSL